MSKNAKLIIAILFLLFIVSVGFALSTYSQKTDLEQNSASLQADLSKKEQDVSKLQADIRLLSDDKATLARQAEEAMAAKSRVDSQLAQLNSNLQDLEGRLREMKNRADGLSTERDDWRNRYREIQKERDDAIAKIREQEARLAAQPAAVMPAPVLRTRSDARVEEDYWAEVLQEKAELSLRISDLQGELAKSSMEIEEFKKKNMDLNLEITYLKSEKEEATQKIIRTQQAIDRLSVDLVREKNHKQTILDRVDHLRQENLTLRAQVKELGAMKVILEKSVAKIQEEKDKIERKLVETETIIQSRIDEVASIRRSIDQRLMEPPQDIMLPPIVVSSSTQQPTSRKKSSRVDVQESYGAIININRENNFVIVDLGEDAGIRIGDTFSVYRGASYIGNISVIQVRKEISAADIVQQSTPLQVGDIVK